MQHKNPLTEMLKLLDKESIQLPTILIESTTWEPGLVQISFLTNFHEKCSKKVLPYQIN